MLERTGLESLSQALSSIPPSKRVSYLIGAFLHPKEEVRWKAIIAFGLSVSEIAEMDLEKARILIRRLMWMLNEESGSMAWGVGEGFAEALYHSELLKREYLQIYVSYIWPEGNYLEFPPAQRGIIWGIGRLAQKYKEDLIKISAPNYLTYHFNSVDPLVVFLSLWSFSFFKEVITLKEELLVKAFRLLEVKTLTPMFFDGKEIKTWTLSQLKKLYNLS
ncbi:MAG: DVU0298 family protein [Caldimicrobium sp.]